MMSDREEELKADIRKLQRRVADLTGGNAASASGNAGNPSRVVHPSGGALPPPPAKKPGGSTVYRGLEADRVRIEELQARIGTLEAQIKDLTDLAADRLQQIEALEDRAARRKDELDRARVELDAARKPTVVYRPLPAHKVRIVELETAVRNLEMQLKSKRIGTDG